MVIGVRNGGRVISCIGNKYHLHNVLKYSECIQEHIMRELCLRVALNQIAGAPSNFLHPNNLDNCLVLVHKLY